MEESGVLGSKGLQSRITRFFHTLHVPLTKLESYCPSHQTLITDYFREIDPSNVVSESYFNERTVSFSFESVSQAFTYTLSSIPSCEPQTPVSKFFPSDSSFTHMSETPEIQLARDRAKMVARYDNMTQEGRLVHRTLW